MFAFLKNSWEILSMFYEKRFMIFFGDSSRRDLEKVDHKYLNIVDHKTWRSSSI
jgi:hypothetical protein